jgi:hypothetical protein
MKKYELLKHYGSISAVARVEEVVLQQGKARGMRAINVKCGDLYFQVLPDRGMDISYCEYQGIQLAFISKTGLVAPSHYDETDFLRSFTGGLLTTCGLTYMGAPCVDEGESLGIHGRISNTPAYDVSVIPEWVEDSYCITIRGKVCQSKVFSENLVLTREIKVKLGELKINISDKVENEGYEKAHLMLLYHFNFGYPLINENAILEINLEKPISRDAIAEKGINEHNLFDQPTNQYQEQVFYHKASPKTQAKLYNKELGIGVKLSFDNENLPYLIEWKQMGEGDYAVGIEPSTNTPEGRKRAKETGELKYIDPFEVKKFDICLEIIEK